MSEGLLHNTAALIIDDGGLLRSHELRYAEPTRWPPSFSRVGRWVTVEQQASSLGLGS